MIIERFNLPTALPFDPTALAIHCRVDGVAGLAEVTAQGRVAAADIEQMGNVALFDQGIRVTLDHWTRAALLALPIAPLLDVLSVTVTVGGEAFDGFAVVTGQRPTLRLTERMPSGVVVIEYVAGFGDVLADLPADLTHAVMDQASAYYDARGLGDGKGLSLSPHAARITARYRRVAL